MSLRDDLSRAVRAAFSVERHEMSEAPDGPAQHIGYVQLPGAVTLKVARWRDGEWLTEKLKPFPKTPLYWYSVEVRSKAKGAADGEKL